MAWTLSLELLLAGLLVILGLVGVGEVAASWREREPRLIPVRVGCARRERHGPPVWRSEAEEE